MTTSRLTRWLLFYLAMLLADAEYIPEDGRKRLPR